MRCVCVLSLFFFLSLSLQSSGRRKRKKKKKIIITRRRRRRRQTRRTLRNAFQFVGFSPDAPFPRFEEAGERGKLGFAPFQW